jgi:hypothetical protein
MVSKKLAARLEKKQDELISAQEKVTVLKVEVTDLKKQVQLELLQKLQENLQTENLTDIEQFIAQVTPTDNGGEPNGD